MTGTITDINLLRTLHLPHHTRLLLSPLLLLNPPRLGRTIAIRIIRFAITAVCYAARFLPPRKLRFSLHTTTADFFCADAVHLAEEELLEAELHGDEGLFCVESGFSSMIFLFVVGLPLGG